MPAKARPSRHVLLGGLASLAFHGVALAALFTNAANGRAGEAANAIDIELVAEAEPAQHAPGEPSMQNPPSTEAPNAPDGAPADPAEKPADKAPDPSEKSEERSSRAPLVVAALPEIAAPAAESGLLPKVEPQREQAEQPRQDQAQQDRLDEAKRKAQQEALKERRAKAAREAAREEARESAKREAAAEKAREARDARRAERQRFASLGAAGGGRGSSTSNDAFDGSAVRAAIAGYANSVKNGVCSGLHGTARVAVVVASSGRVASASGSGDFAIAARAASAMRSAHAPGFTGRASVSLNTNFHCR